MATAAIAQADHASQDDRRVGVLVVTTATTGAQTAMRHGPVELGTHKHLFIDLTLADRVANVDLRLNPPRFGGVAIGRDRAWEHHFKWGHTVLDDGGLVKMWYASSPPGRGQSKTFRWMYAESHDGLHWTKPDLGLVPVGGSNRTNLLPYGRGQVSVFVDPMASPDRRYQSFGRNMDPDHGPLGFGLLGSADGLTFRPLGANGITYMGDTQNMAFWDDRVHRYVAYVRAWVAHDGGDPRRAVARWETDDLTGREGWDLTNPPLEIRGRPTISHELPVVLAPDGDDPPDMDIYSPSVVQYPWADDVYIATLAMYRHFAPTEAGSETPSNDGLTEIQLALSRDGITWQRPDRTPYVPLDTAGPGSQQVYSGLGMVRRADAIYQYHVAYDQSHGVRRGNAPGGVIRWTEQRLDGFVSATFAPAGGELTTRPITFEGSRLELNVDASAAGEARVEVQDIEGHPVEGRALNDCDRVLGNHLRRQVSWHGDTGVGVAPGTPIRLRLVMRAAKLYTLQFTHGEA